ncbi:hypothetical protein [Saccharothrix texasensis]|uniref:Uncharacterized protein n=1 Tax=Saccharothrix texasensis TaxID=103734 RepID=A0A3N1HH21_9PSEU|nr:hypothetical protein [Saccharothrix texasensis]ROP41795.1 hypothetical protein EDD40_7250 [Saccharothrix texasensis]
MISQSTQIEQSASSTAVAACAPAAWDCQMHAYMETPANVATNLAAVPSGLVERRVYMLMVQGDDRAEAHWFERFAAGIKVREDPTAVSTIYNISPNGSW